MSRGNLLVLSHMRDPMGGLFVPELGILPEKFCARFQNNSEMVHILNFTGYHRITGPSEVLKRKAGLKTLPWI